jgi:hypothetical protein
VAPKQQREDEVSVLDQSTGPSQGLEEQLQGDAGSVKASTSSIVLYVAFGFAKLALNIAFDANFLKLL